jgi:hypothetical protein
MVVRIGDPAEVSPAPGNTFTKVEFGPAQEPRTTRTG